MDATAVFEELFAECGDDDGRIQSDEQWRQFVRKLVSHGCVGVEETSALHTFWDNQKDSVRAFGRDDAPINLTFAQFEAFVLRMAQSEPLMSSAMEYLEDLVTQTDRMVAMGQRWGTAGLDAAHARQLQQLLHDIGRLDAVVVKHVQHSIRDQDTLMKAERDARMIHAPIAQQRREAAASRRAAGDASVDDDDAGAGKNCLWFQNAHVARIQSTLARRKVGTRRYKVQFRHISCNGPHLLGHAPFFRCGVPPRKVEVAAADTFLGVDHDGAERYSKASDIAVLGAWHATRIDVSRRQCVAAGDPFELEVVRLHAAAPQPVTEQVMAEVAAHREMTLSPYFAHLCGAVVADAGYSTFVFEHVQAASVHSLLVEAGRLYETQPMYRFWAQELLRALCDVEEQCCFLLQAPVTLRHVFVSNQGTRLTLGRLPWGRRVSAADASCSALLEQRSRLLSSSFATMLEQLVGGVDGADRDGAGDSVDEAKGAEGGGDDEAATPPRKLFSKSHCLRGLHVRCGQRFEIELPTRAGGYVWEPPTVVSQSGEGDVEVEEEGGGDSLDAVLPDGKTTFATSTPARGEEPRPVAHIPLKATRIGSFSLLMYLHRPWEPLPRQPTCVIQVSIHAATTSPALHAIIAACRRAGERPMGEGEAPSSVVSPPLRLASLKHHPYFLRSTAPSLRMVQADFEASL